VLAALSHESLSSVQNLAAWIGADRVQILHGPRTHNDQVLIGTTVSLMPLGPSVIGVSTNGLQWNLNHEDLAPQSARGVSNIAHQTNINIEIETGVLAIVYPGFLGKSLLETGKQS
jgi:thiamine pyrophosphokinase